MITKEAYTETFIVLETLDLLKNLPQNVLDAIKNNIIPNYKFYIDKDVPIKFQITNKDTLSLLSYLYIRYFCDNQEEKNMLKEKININEEVNKNKRNEEYNLVFKKNISTETIELKNEEETINNMNLIETKKESIIERLMKKVINFIRMNRGK